MSRHGASSRQLGLTDSSETFSDRDTRRPEGFSRTFGAELRIAVAKSNTAVSASRYLGPIIAALAKGSALSLTALAGRRGRFGGIRGARGCGCSETDACREISQMLDG